MSQTSRFIDSFGFLWQIIEVAPTDARGEHADLADVPGWLYFCSRGCTMVLRHYPADWHDLDWGELDVLRMRGEVLSADITRLQRPAAASPTRFVAEA